MSLAKKWAEQVAKAWRKNADRKAAVKQIRAFDSKRKELDLDLPENEKLRGRREPKFLYTLMPGYAWNPLTRFPSNNKCFCGSQKKAKKCCLPHQPRVLPIENVRLIKNHWARILTGKQILPETPRQTEKSF